MSGWVVRQFRGPAPRIAPLLMADNQAQTCTNTIFKYGTLVPLQANSSVATLTKSGVIQTIHRFGQDVDSDSQYWFHWAADVDVARGPVYDDTQERTYFTDGVQPRVTDNSIALTGGTAYPMASYILGVPAPSAAPIAVAGPEPVGGVGAASVTLTADVITAMPNDVLLGFSQDGSAYTTATVTGAATSTTLKAAIDAASIAWMTATISGSDLILATVATGVGASIYVRQKTGTTDDLTATPTYGAENLSAVGSASYTGYIVIDDAELGDLDEGDVIKISIKSGIDGEVTIPSGFANTAAALAALINSDLTTLDAVVYGSCVVIEQLTSSASDDWVEYTRTSSAGAVMKSVKAGNSVYASPARLFITEADVVAFVDAYAAFKINSGVESYVKVVAGITPAALSLPSTLTSKTYGTLEPFVVLSTKFAGSGASIVIRDATFATTDAWSDTAYDEVFDTDGLTEDRVYVVTFVTAWGEEGCPSDASNAVTVYTDQSVELTLPSVPTSGSNFASKRIYRSVNGTNSSAFLFVAEVAAATESYTDLVVADALGEELPSLNYEMPPTDLQGLVAGANGVMAGFTGKYVYFCEPYKPHAWPSSYAVAVDADVVAVKPFDSSWLVLTKSRPYIVMGSHPDSYAQTRQALQQACVSKRSVAIADNGIVYASPDGLFMVGGGSSRNVTESVFTRIEWQALQPATLHGYVVDNLYVGFFSATNTGFVLDLNTADFCWLDWYASAGYYDPIRDKLFLVTGSNQLVSFDSGANLTQVWKSKPFYSAKALNLGAARVEAGAYDNGSTQDLTMKVYADGVLKHTQTVTDGEAFRLPDGFLANRWEFQVEGNVEITSAGFAETVQELAGG